jgi:two-component system response regulator FlrC
MSEATVLVVEDDADLREALCDTLQFAGYQTLGADDGPTALGIIEQRAVGMVISDVQMEPMDGNALLSEVKRKHPSLPVIMMTAYGSIEKAVRAMREGAADYLTKPFEAEVLINLAERLLPVGSEDDTTGSMVCRDDVTKRLAHLACRVATSDVTVMISGASGTGKEMLARYIHNHSLRNEGPFVAINCAAIPDNMLEAVLFGYEKGAFTGAYKGHAGKFEQAQGGTLLLDEISEMDLGLQAKLLRVLQEREVERLGGQTVIALDVRLLATTNRNLHEDVAAGRFREDLFYRLNVFPLDLPPLCERPGDILPLAHRFLRAHRMRGASCPMLSEAAEDKLCRHNWPGNVRELANVIQRALILMQGDVVQAEDLVLESAPAAPQPQPAANNKLDDDLKVRERALIVDALRKGAGSRKEAARYLGISPRTLRYKMARLREMGLEIPRETA